MHSINSKKDKKGSFRKNAGFYISLALCIAAVAGAAWTTYGSIEEYSVQPELSSDTDEMDVNRELSGESYESSVPEESSRLPETSRRESSQTPVKKSPELSQKAAEPVAAAANAEAGTEKPKAQKPVEKGEIIKGFSVKDPLWSETMGDWRSHCGVDISAENGAPVRAIFDGKVKSLYSDPMLGNVICISHDGGYEALYCGVTDFSIASEGNNVKAGDTIGYVGTIPSESKDKSHIHLEVRYNGSRIDPSMLF